MKKLNFKANDTQFKKNIKPILAYDLSNVYPNLEVEEKKRLLDLMGLDKMTDMFVELDVEDQLDLLHYLDDVKKRSLFRNMESDDLKEFLSDIDDDLRLEMMVYLTKVKQKTIALLLTYDEDEAASIMSPDFMTISIDDTIKEATDHVIKDSRDIDYIDTIYVVDDQDKMIGYVDLKDLIIARNSSAIKKIMEDDFQFVFSDEPIEKAIQTVVNYDRNVIPVLDSEMHILGILTADDIFDELIESTESDYQNLALLGDHESDSSALERVRQRLPWLMLAVLLNLVNASILSLFEATLIQVSAIVLFQPMILGMAGNIGTQALAVTILGIHKNEFEEKSLPKRHVLKEIGVGLFNSILLGLTAFGFVTLYLTLLPTAGTEQPYQMGLVVFSAVFGSMFISSQMGVFVPILMNRFGQDPSAASGPMMTTINDLVALMIYFGIATLAFL
jgi:magnesium transporter